MLNRFLLLFVMIGVGDIAVAQDSLNVHHLFNWQDTTLPIGDGGLQNRYNEVWGYAANGREYAIIGSTTGMHFFDVTEPTLTVQVDHVPGRFGGAGLVHRDMRVYADHLFVVCDEGPSSLQVMDLRYLPDSVHVVYDDNTLLARAHNIEIDTVNARMYTCGGSSQFSIYSIADPASPELLMDCEAYFPWWSNAIGYVHDCFVRDNIVWLNDQDALHVVDFNDVENPVIIGALTSYPDQGYNHSGWMNDVGTLYVMADETHGSPLKLIDATDPLDLNIISTLTSGVDPTSIAHNPFFTGDRVHVAYYYDGYWLWDASNPELPELLGYYDTNLAPNANGFRGAWGVYPYLPSGNILVSDLQTGLWVLAYDAPTGIQPASGPPPFRIAPTLTTGSIRVQTFKEEHTALPIEVINATGAIVRSFTLAAVNSMELDLSDLADGSYLITVGKGSDRYTQRVIKSSAR